VTRLATADENDNPHAILVDHTFGDTRLYTPLDKKPA
jgi:hypothetical protein